MLELFNQFRKRVLNLDSSVTEEMLKLYIAYKSSTNFVDVVPQKSRLRLSINMRFSEIDDPKGLCKDVTNLGRWGNGDVEVGLSSAGQLEDVMYLVTQSFERNVDNGEH
jgi:predicted transport protein